jgi:hypothetical protein
MSRVAATSPVSRSTGDGSGAGPVVWAVAAAVLLLLAAILAWWFGWLSFRTDPRVVEIQQMQEEAQQQFSANGGPATVTDAMAAVTTMNTIRAKVEALPPHLREQVERRGAGMFQSAMRARIDAYYQAPPTQRQAIIDRQIDQEEAMSKAFEAARSVAGAFGGGATASGSSAPTSGGTSGGGGPPGGPRRSGNEDDRNRRIKSIIDRTTPEQRAQWVEYRRAMDERRAQRGLPPGWGR